MLTDSSSSIAYLVNQSTAYEAALITGILEFWLEYFYPPYTSPTVFVITRLRVHPITFWIGFSLCLCGGLLRAIGEIQLGSNFAHQIEVRKSESHELVTTGLYAYVPLPIVTIRDDLLCSIFRHPAYTGWFYFSIGTQLILNNPLCTIAYTVAAWYFFYDRIPYEEGLLLNFFPDYYEYREHTFIFIPFIPKVGERKGLNTQLL